MSRILQTIIIKAPECVSMPQRGRSPVNSFQKDTSVQSVTPFGLSFTRVSDVICYNVCVCVVCWRPIGQRMNNHDPQKLYVLLLGRQQWDTNVYRPLGTFLIHRMDFLFVFAWLTNACYTVCLPQKARTAITQRLTIWWNDLHHYQAILKKRKHLHA